MVFITCNETIELGNGQTTYCIKEQGHLLKDPKDYHCPERPFDNEYSKALARWWTKNRPTESFYRPSHIFSQD